MGLLAYRGSATSTSTSGAFPVVVACSVASVSLFFYWNAELYFRYRHVNKLPFQILSIVSFSCLFNMLSSILFLLVELEVGHTHFCFGTTLSMYFFYITGKAVLWRFSTLRADMASLSAPFKWMNVMCDYALFILIGFYCLTIILTGVFWRSGTALWSCDIQVPIWLFLIGAPLGDLIFSLVYLVIFQAGMHKLHSVVKAALTTADIKQTERDMRRHYLSNGSQLISSYTIYLIIAIAGASTGSLSLLLVDLTMHVLTMLTLFQGKDRIWGPVCKCCLSQKGKRESIPNIDPSQSSHTGSSGRKISTTGPSSRDHKLDVIQESDAEKPNNLEAGNQDFEGSLDVSKGSIDTETYIGEDAEDELVGLPPEDPSPLSVQAERKQSKAHFAILDDKKTPETSPATSPRHRPKQRSLSTPSLHGEAPHITDRGRSGSLSRTKEMSSSSPAVLQRAPTITLHDGESVLVDYATLFGWENRLSIFQDETIRSGAVSIYSDRSSRRYRGMSHTASSYNSSSTLGPSIPSIPRGSHRTASSNQSTLSIASSMSNLFRRFTNRSTESDLNLQMAPPARRLQSQKGPQTRVPPNRSHRAGSGMPSNNLDLPGPTSINATNSESEDTILRGIGIGSVSNSMASSLSADSDRPALSPILSESTTSSQPSPKKSKPNENESTPAMEPVRSSSPGSRVL